VDQPLARSAFAAALRAQADHYWDKHPFHIRLHAGECTVDEIRCWVANRWYYQRHLAQKNAAVIANCPLPEVRRLWTERIAFHDGSEGSANALDDWLLLAESVGLATEEVLDERHVLRGVRFAVDGYVTFCRTRPWWEAVAAALTELFSPEHMSDRVHAWRAHYRWIQPGAAAYFARRIPVARQDSDITLGLVLQHCTTAERQQVAIAALAFKCDVLNAMLDAVDYASCR
jgi:pyrroloquinoline-quinone synthase